MKTFFICDIRFDDQAHDEEESESDQSDWVGDEEDQMMNENMRFGGNQNQY